MVLTKHLINNPSTLVVEALQGLVYLNPHLSLDVKNKVVYRSELDKSQVSLICGGGSGHEPSHSGFVGEGMLTAAVCGNIFASPNANQVTRAIELVDGDAGTLIIVKNYTGDVLNFGLAKEQYAAAHPDKSKKVKFLIVGDDVSVGKKQGGIVGRRGLAGTVLVYKIAGAMAARGSNIDSIYDVAEWVSKRLGTVGVGLEHCHIPGTGPAESHLSANAAELGMGIHNEPGYKQVSPIPGNKGLIHEMLDLLTSTMDSDRSFLPFGAPGNRNDEVVLLVNNLGAVSELELSGIAKEAAEQLEQKRIKVKRLLVGTFMTSLNMPGFSLTLLLLPRQGEESPISASDFLTLLDDKPNVPGWKWSSGLALPEKISTHSNDVPPAAATLAHTSARKVPAPDPKAFTEAIRRAATSIIKNEPELTKLDSIVGDGDAGLTHKSGAEHVLKALDNGSVNGDDVVGSVAHISKAVRDGMDGTSGAIYSIFFSALVQSLNESIEGKDAFSLDVWKDALRSALRKLYTYTPARPPSRTLIDPLAAFVQSLEDGDNLESAVAKAGEAADNTKNLEAKAGRAAYVDREKVKGTSDPGAEAVKFILQAFLA